MMCYKDMTFCDGGNPKCVKFDSCHRALTDDVIKAAHVFRLGICRYENPEKVSCYSLGEKTKEKPESEN